MLLSAFLFQIAAVASALFPLIVYVFLYSFRLIPRLFLITVRWNVAVSSVPLDRQNSAVRLAPVMKQSFFLSFYFDNTYI